jgi:hypothetical protein
MVGETRLDVLGPRSISFRSQFRITGLISRSLAGLVRHEDVMSWYAGALTAAIVLAAGVGSKSSFAGSGSAAAPRATEQRRWADEVSEAIRSGRAGGTAARDVTRTGEIGQGGSSASSGGASGNASGAGRGEGPAAGSDLGKAGERGGPGQGNDR